MARYKHDPEWIIARVHEYLSGQGSYKSIAKANGIDYKSLKIWVGKYKEHGELAFYSPPGNRKYSKQFKMMCVEAVLSGENSVTGTTIKYNISDPAVLRGWISKYNADIELRDYDPKKEVYMATARRKTTLNERKEIVEYCLSHNKDYKGAASTYDVSYSQVYSWVKKYDERGEEGLFDKRGHHKTDDEVDELERLRRENLRLKRQLEEKEMAVELLKKVKEFERM